MVIHYFKNCTILLLCALVLSACSSARTAQSLQRGRSNFEAGSYRESFHQLLPLASEGNREAEYAVGYMYYYGYGVARDPDTGIFWIQKSADQRYEPAMNALTVMKKS